MLKQEPLCAAVIFAGMADPAVSPERIVSVVEAGETDQVNQLIDDLERLEVEKRLTILDSTFETLLDCMELDDGYSRQTTVRIVDAVDLGTGRLAARSTSEELDTKTDDEQFKQAINRASALFVAALADEDGRVRRASIHGLKNLSVGCQLVGDQTTLRQIHQDIEELSVGDQCHEHVTEARETVLSHLS